MNKLAVKGVIRKIRSHFTLNNGVLVVALLIAATWVWSTIQAIQHNFTLQQQIDELEQQIAVEELQNKTLELQRAYYNSDQYLELSARERMNLAQPGEKVLMLPPNTVKSQPASSGAPGEQAAPERSNFAQWMYFLFGKKGS